MSSKLKSLVLAGTAMAATALGLKPAVVKPKKRFVVTKKAGKKGDAFRRIVKHETSEQIIQTGIRWIHGEAHPIMRRVRIHRFYHATKGWRTYHDIVPHVRPAQRAA